MGECARMFIGGNDESLITGLSHSLDITKEFLFYNKNGMTCD